MENHAGKNNGVMRMTSSSSTAGSTTFGMPSILRQTRPNYHVTPFGARVQLQAGAISHPNLLETTSSTSSANIGQTFRLGTRENMINVAHGGQVNRQAALFSGSYLTRVPGPSTVRSASARIPIPGPDFLCGLPPIPKLPTGTTPVQWPENLLVSVPTVTPVHTSSTGLVSVTCLARTVVSFSSMDSTPIMTTESGFQRKSDSDLGKTSYVNHGVSELSSMIPSFDASLLQDLATNNSPCTFPNLQRCFPKSEGVQLRTQLEGYHPSDLESLPVQRECSPSFFSTDCQHDSDSWSGSTSGTSFPNCNEKLFHESHKSCLTRTIFSGRSANLQALPYNEPGLQKQPANEHIMDSKQSAGTSSVVQNPANLNSDNLAIREEDQSHQMSGARIRKVAVRKLLRTADIRNSGRIVLSKKEAEANLPPLTEVQKNLFIEMHEIGAPNKWIFQYRFWRNNKSRMYIMQNKDFIRRKDLRSGDLLIIYKEECTSKDGTGKYLVQVKLKPRAPYSGREIQRENNGLRKPVSSRNRKRSKSSQNSVSMTTKFLTQNSDHNAHSKGLTYEFDREGGGSSQIGSPLPDLNLDKTSY